MARKFIALTSGEHSFRTVTISLKDVLYPKTSLSLFSGSPDALSLQRQTPLSKTENLFSKDRDSLTKNTRAYVLPWEVYHGPFVQSVPSFSHLVQFCQSQFLYWRNATGLSFHLRHWLHADPQTRETTPQSTSDADFSTPTNAGISPNVVAMLYEGISPNWAGCSSVGAFFHIFSSSRRN